jgi:hypothetical protein
MIGRWLLSGVLVTTLAYAQRGGGGGGDMGEGEGGIGGGRGSGMSGMGSGMGGIRRLSKLEMFEEKLKLNKEQKEEVQTAYSATMEKSAPLREIISKGRQVIVNAMLAGKSADDVNKMFSEYAMVSAQMTAAEAEFFAKVYAMLKPNQQSKAPAAFELVAGMFAGGGMPGGTGGMGGRRGGRN